MNKNTIQKIVLVLIVVLIIYQFVDISYIAKVKENISLQNDEIVNLQSKLSKIEPYANRIKDLKNSINKNEEEINKIDNIVPHKEDVPELIKYFYNLCNTKNIKGDVVGFERINLKDKKYSIVSVNLTASGNEEDIQNFLKEIQNNPFRLMNIDKVTITPSQTGTTINMKILIYRQITLQ